MNWELVVTESGRVFIAADRPFPADVAKVALLADQRLLRIDYDDGEGPALLPFEIDETLLVPLSQASEAMVIYMEGLHPVEGFRAPLVRE